MQQQVIEECVALYDAKVGYNENVKNKIGPYIVQKMDMYPLSLVKSIVHKECTAELGRLKTGVDRDRIASLVRGILEKLEDKPRICTENKNNLPVCTDIDGMNESILANMPIDSAAKIVKAAAFSGRILIEGMLRKRGQHVNLWRPRYFKIRSTSVNVAGDGNSSNAIGPYVLCYYRKKDDLEPRDWFVLGPGCVVDEVRESPSKIESKRLFTFRLSFACSGNEDVVDADTPNSAIDILTQTPDGPRSRKLSQSEREALTSSKKRHQRRAKVAASAAMATTAVLLTGGIAGAGLIASTAMASAAGISAARVNSMLQSNHGSTVSLAAESKENAEWWRKNIVDCIAEADAKWNELLAKQDVALNLPPAVIEKSRLRPRAGSIGLVPKALSKSLKNSIHLIADNSWTCYDCLDEITVYQERRLGVATPSMKTSMTIQASADAVFELLMDLNSSYYTTNSVLKAAEVVTTVDHHSDIIYYQLHSCFLWPFHTKPRDMCMLRYWRLEENGCYAICFQSATHPECPENSKYTRANVLGGCYIIAPSIKDVLLGKSGLTSCRVTLVCQIDPAGWIASPLGDKCYMKQAFAVKYLQQIASIRAVLVHEQFETIKPYSNDLEPQTSPLASSLHQILEDFQAMHGTRNLQIAESGQCGFEKLSDDLKEKVSAFNSMRKPQVQICNGLNCVDHPWAYSKLSNRQSERSTCVGLIFWILERSYNQVRTILCYSTIIWECRK